MSNSNIKNFPDIKIDGIQHKIYNLSLSGGGQRTAELNIHLLGKVNYNPDIEKVYSIAIGAFYSFQGYLVSSRYTESSEGFYTELSFVDTSIRLDRIYVGLKGKHGVNLPSYPQSNQTVPVSVLPRQLVNKPLSKTPPSTSPVSIFATAGYLAPENIILVGDAVNPCPDISTITTKDPCNPCKNINTEYDDQTFNCEEKKILKLWEVDYTFKQLIDAAQNKDIYFSGDFNPSNIQNYRSTTVGTLRDVLTEWCSIFGYTFYWQNNTVHFISLAQGITINTSKVTETCRVESKTETTSISDITKTVNMAYFGKEGDIESYTCAKKNPGTILAKKTRLLNAISISDVTTGNAYVEYIYKGDENFKVAVALGRYSEKLRNFYCWNNILQYTKPSQVKIGKTPIMGWEIIAVCHENMTEQQVKDPKKLDQYKSLYGTLTSPSSSRGNFFSPSEAAKRKNYGVYFVVVKPLSSEANNAFLMEQEVAKNFCGKYWSDKIIDSDIDENDFITPPETNLKKITESVSLEEMLGDENLNLSRPFYKESQKLINLNENFLTGNVLLLSRGALWSPATDDDNVKSFLEAFNEMDMDRIEPMVSLQGNEQLWAIYSLDKGIQWSVSTENTNRSVYGVPKPAGLRGTTVKKISLTIKPPSARTLTRLDNILMPSEGPYLIEEVPKETQNTVKILIPKCEVLIGERDNNTGNNFTKIQVNRKDISNDNVQNLQSLAGSSCHTDTAKIITYGQSIIDDISNDLPIAKRNIEYTIFGIPEVPISFEDGLQSFSINVSRNGSRTNLNFSNIFPQGLSDEAKINNVKYLIEGKKNTPYKRSL